MRIGIDFDNTLVRYDRLLALLAAEMGLPPEVQGKRAIRDWLRASAEGDVAWQKVQGRLYGPRLGEADPMPGALAFMRLCAANGAEMVIVSHKTEFAGYDPTRTPLRAAATAWMEAHGLFTEIGLRRDRVFYESTRAEKVARIADLKVDAFIDDLEEVFLEPGFPEGVERFLFHPAPGAPPGPYRVMDSFSDIGDALFPG